MLQVYIMRTKQMADEEDVMRNKKQDEQDDPEQDNKQENIKSPTELFHDMLTFWKNTRDIPIPAEELP